MRASEKNTPEHLQKRGWTGVRVTRMVKTRLEQLAAERSEDIGRAVSYNEIIEQLIIEWGNRT
jgi:hypothetical protein